MILDVFLCPIFHSILESSYLAGMHHQSLEHKKAPSSMLGAFEYILEQFSYSPLLLLLFQFFHL